jgi:lysophospholipase L1-like esterase
VIRLEKLTESQTGGSRLFGLYPIGQTVPLEAPSRVRQIEFIGDSYTVGYGNTSGSRQCTQREIHDTTDTQQAFGPLAARRLDADYRITAYSGRGIVRNYDGVVPGESMIALYPRAKPDDPRDRERIDPAWNPQVIVINLGTNDFSTKLHAAEKWADDAALRADYRQAYADFVRGLHASHPRAHFVLMGSDTFFGEVQQVAADVNRISPGLATPLEFGGLELTACDWHPSLADDRKLADLLAPVVMQAAGWKLAQSKRLLRGKPIGGMRPAAPRAARHGERSLSVRTRPLSPPSAQLSPSLSENAIASDNPPSR